MLSTWWGSGPQPPDHQSAVHPTEPTRPARGKMKQKLYMYSGTAIAQTLMARLPWLIGTRFESLQNFSDSSRKQIFREIFLFHHEIVCCVYSLESPHQGNLMNTFNIQLLCKKQNKNFLTYRYLLPDLAPWLTLSGSNYPCLEQFSMDSKMFEPLKFDCILVLYGPPHAKTCLRACADSKGPAQPVQLPSQTRVFIVC